MNSQPLLHDRVSTIKTSYNTIHSIHTSQRCISVRQFLEALVLRKYAAVLPAMPRTRVPKISLIVPRVRARYCSYTLVRPYQTLTVVLHIITLRIGPPGRYLTCIFTPGETLTRKTRLLDVFLASVHTRIYSTKASTPFLIF